jgi:tRNA A-37 threonylcarbamoyl transferase component Bud32
MDINSAKDLVATVRSLHLVAPAHLEKLTALSQVSDARTWATQSVSQGILTPLQANQLIQGRAQELILGPYVLIERIGAGGMGEVYKARNWKMGRVVALKVIRKDQLQSETAVGRFYREIRAASQLSHPNVVTAFDAGQQGGTHYFAMEYVDASDLSRRVKQEGPLPVAQACEFMRQAALGLQHAHQRGMVHRDIKPSNLLVARNEAGEGVVKILDMGLARMATQDDSVGTLTQEGSVLGTLDYLSPEQALNAHQADIRSDIYSLGCTFYFLLAGQPPFPGGTATEKLLKHRFEEPVPVEQVRRGVPVQVAAVVRKMMAKEPADRFQTPAEVAAILAGGPERIPALDAGSTVVLGRRRGLSRVSRRLVGIAAALALLLGIGMVAGLLFRNSSGAVPPSAGEAPRRELPTELQYVKKDTREGTILATLQANRLAALQGKWYVLGALDGTGVDMAHPVEKKIELQQTYPGSGGKPVGWKEYNPFPLGKTVRISDLVPNQERRSLCYLYHEFTVDGPIDVLLAVGSDGSNAVWHNDKQVYKEPVHSYLTPERIKVVTIACKPGRNTLLIKLWSAFADARVYVCPQWPAKLREQFEARLNRDFPQ